MMHWWGMKHPVVPDAQHCTPCYDHQLCSRQALVTEGLMASRFSPAAGTGLQRSQSVQHALGVKCTYVPGHCLSTTLPLTMM